MFKRVQDRRRIATHAESPSEQVFRSHRDRQQRDACAGGTRGDVADSAVAAHDKQGFGVVECGRDPVIAAVDAAGLRGHALNVVARSGEGFGKLAGCSLGVAAARNGIEDDGDPHATSRLPGSEESRQ